MHVIIVECGAIYIKMVHQSTFMCLSHIEI